MTIVLILAAAMMADAPETEPEHAKNEVYTALLDRGMIVEGKAYKLPRPWLVDGQDGETQKRILVRLVRSTKELEAHLDRDRDTENYFDDRESVAKRGSALVRFLDLWFVVYADLDKFSPNSQAKRMDGKEGGTEQFNFKIRLLKDEELRKTKLDLGRPDDDSKTFFTRLDAQLPSDVEIAVTNRTVSSRTANSVVLATQTDPTFDRSAEYSNTWRLTAGDATKKTANRPRPYQGGISYTKVNRLAFRPGALIVEMHSAWVEPWEWFEGADPMTVKLRHAADKSVRELREKL
jgi:hypothetical protein